LPGGPLATRTNGAPPTARKREAGTPVINGLVSVIEGVGDAIVGGVSLAVDAVGIGLAQNRDAVPGAPGDLGA
jgi:hypothetical protein